MNLTATLSEALTGLAELPKLLSARGPKAEQPVMTLPLRYLGDHNRVQQIAGDLRSAIASHELAPLTEALGRLQTLNQEFIARDKSSGSNLGGLYSTHLLLSADPKLGPDAERASMHMLRMILRENVWQEILVFDVDTPRSTERRQALVETAGDLMRFEHERCQHAEIFSDSLLHKFVRMEISRSEAIRWRHMMDEKYSHFSGASAADDSMYRYSVYNSMLEIPSKAIEAAHGTLLPQYAAAQERALERLFSEQPGARAYFDRLVERYVSAEDVGEIHRSVGKRSPQAQLLARAYRNAAIAFTDEISELSSDFAQRVRERNRGNPDFRSAILERTRVQSGLL